MKLIERADFFASMQSWFEKTGDEGHCLFISGEAGIGKTTLVTQFCKTHNECIIYTGTCDDLFTPRPLAPLYDIAWQMGGTLPDDIKNFEDRATLFSNFLHQLKNQRQKVILVFEDIHWADEATLDFIKFFARRIISTNCLFIITFRSNEIGSSFLHSNIFGELISGSLTHLKLTPLSKDAVEKMAQDKGYNGEDVYSISGGNPFYVNEILASYSSGIPENIKDSILSVFNRHPADTRYLWEILSVLPTGLETGLLEKIVPGYKNAITYSLDSHTMIIKNDRICFKHELYRRTIEESLPSLKRIDYNRKILELFCEYFEETQQTERIIHHAKEAKDFKVVVHFAPMAARQAANSGAHAEARKLYLTAISFIDPTNTDALVPLYDAYAYECYLTNQVNEAILYQEKALKIWKNKNEPERIGNSMCFLSRLWWFDGERTKAEFFGRQAVAVLENQPSSKAKAMAYSNMAHLEMQNEQMDNCIIWGEKAIEVARDIGDEETISQALNSIGTAIMLDEKTVQKGIQLLIQGLNIAIRNGFHELIARSYIELGTNGVTIKNYALAKEYLDKGLQYCEERDIDSLKLYISAWRARLFLETGEWDKASGIAEILLLNKGITPPAKITALIVDATIKIRRGNTDAVALMLEANARAFKTKELVRIVPALMGLLEYEWLTGKSYIEPEILSETVKRIVALNKFSKKSRFYFWLLMAGKETLLPKDIVKDVGYNDEEIYKLVDFWKETGSPYERALAMFRGNADDKREALGEMQKLGAKVVYEKLKKEMRSSGIKKIPRGMRQNTCTNPAQLTDREMDVLQLLKEGMQNKEIARRLYISAKTVDHHISSILFKLDVNSRMKAVREAFRLAI